MAWTDKLIEARYTSPSGRSFSFLYENLRKRTSLKTALFLFPEKDGAYLQSLGRAGRTFPISCIFSGADCMDEASAFETALEERGVGELQHPVYGTFKVVPTGELDRTDDLISGANQVIVDVVFAETMLADNTLSSSLLKEDKIAESLDRFNDAAALEFGELLKVGNVSELIFLQNTFKSQVSIIDEKLRNLARKDPKIYTKFLTLAKEMPEAIENIVQDGIVLGRKILNYIAAPSRIVTDVLAKVQGYTGLVDTLINQYKKDPFRTNDIHNQYAATKLCLYDSVVAVSSGAAVSSLKISSQQSGAAFSSRQQAISVAANIRTLFDVVQNFVDDKNSKDIWVDAGSGYEAMLEVVKESIDIIINTAFQLPVQRVITLDQDRQIIELMAELYGNFNHIDEFIIENKLTADEIEVLPRGRKVIYYAEVA